MILFIVSFSGLSMPGLSCATLLFYYWLGTTAQPRSLINWQFKRLAVLRVAPLIYNQGGCFPPIPDTNYAVITPHLHDIQLTWNHVVSHPVFNM